MGGGDVKKKYLPGNPVPVAQWKKIFFWVFSDG
jgi:hypothetical protein